MIGSAVLGALSLFVIHRRTCVRACNEPFRPVEQHQETQRKEHIACKVFEEIHGTEEKPDKGHHEEDASGKRPRVRK